jgi:hypothetical protein
VRRDARGALRLLALPTVALAVIAAAAPGRLELAARIYALVVGAVALVVAIRALRRVDPPETPPRGPKRAIDRGRQPPPSLARLEQLAALGVASSFDLQYRLAPQLRAIADGLLASRRRIDATSDPGAARDALGEDIWQVVRPGPVREDRVGRGVSPAQLAQIADSLERI